jgi:hypothetical protein
MKWSNEMMKEQMAALNSMFSASQSIKPEEIQTKSKEINDQYLIKIKNRGEKLNQDRAAYDALLKEDWRNRKAVREKLGFSLSRVSPASAFHLASVNLAETGMSLKNRYEDQLRDFRDIFSKFRAKKELEENDNYQAMVEGKGKPIDISEVPQFKYLNTDMVTVLRSTIIDVGILAFYILITIAGTFIAFIRYDVR